MKVLTVLSAILLLTAALAHARGYEAEEERGGI